MSALSKGQALSSLPCMVVRAVHCPNPGRAMPVESMGLGSPGAGQGTTCMVVCEWTWEGSTNIYSAAVLHQAPCKQYYGCDLILSSSTGRDFAHSIDAAGRCQVFASHMKSPS